jgi:hypothetical protein
MASIDRAHAVLFCGSRHVILLRAITVKAEQPRYGLLIVLYSALWLGCVSAMIFNYPEKYSHEFGGHFIIAFLFLGAICIKWIGGLILPIIACRTAQKLTRRSPSLNVRSPGN